MPNKKSKRKKREREFAVGLFVAKEMNARIELQKRVAELSAELKSCCTCRFVNGGKTLISITECSYHREARE